jgi:uncharacterized damage-inducible protein DinB
MSTNPYAQYLEGLDVVASLEETPRRLQALVAGWPREAFERRYAPGKWTARQILAHLAQAEMVFSNRLRFGLTVPGYVVQPFDQDDWMAVDEGVDAASSLAAYLALRRVNVGVCRRLTPEQRRRPVTHPERGAIDVDWLLVMFAGHERHHLTQLEAIAAAGV